MRIPGHIPDFTVLVYDHRYAFLLNAEQELKSRTDQEGWETPHFQQVIGMTTLPLNLWPVISYF